MSVQCFFFHALLLSLQAYAQNLTWQFSGDVGLNLPQCGTLPVKVKSALSTSQTSYYMIALAAGGTPTTSLIGSGDSLQWTVNQPVNSRLLLHVVGSSGANSHTPRLLYTVTNGSSDCLLSSTSSDFFVTTDASSMIETCDPFNLLIRGGTPPYNVLLASLTASIVTNVTMKITDNRYTYINRAGPQSILFAAISDATGKWATGTPFVSTQGSVDTVCGGAESSGSHGTPPQSLPSIPSPTSSSNSETISATSTGQRPAPSGAKKIPIIVGVVLGVAVLLLLAGIIILIVKKQRSQTQLPSIPDVRTAVNPVVNPFIIPSGYAETTGLGQVHKSVATQPNPPLASGSYLVNNPETSPQRSTMTVPARKSQVPETQDRGGDCAEVLVHRRDEQRLTVQDVPPPYGTQST